MGIINEKYIASYVKEHMLELPKDTLFNLAKEIDGNVKKSRNKDDFLRVILKSKKEDDYYINLYYRLKDNFFGVKTTEMQKLLGINNTELRKLLKKNVVKANYYISKRLYGSYCDIPYYSLIELLDLEKEDIKKYIKVATPKQLESLKKAREVALSNRTCIKCERVYPSKKDLHEGICNECWHEEKVKRKVKDIFENKDKYLIADTETTGVEKDDKIIDIAIIDLEGNILLNTLLYTDKEISEGAYEVNHISKEDLIGKPTFKDIIKEIETIIQDKTLLIFNSSFDVNMMKNNGYKKDIKSQCLMNLYMDYIDTDRWVGLQRALDYEGIEIEQNHRALGDCYCCLELLKKMKGN